MHLQLDEVEQKILDVLLVDFYERGLTAKSLDSCYEGPQIAELSKAICASGDTLSVDFDLVFPDLERKKLVRTGPFAPFPNHPSSNVIMVGGLSKREYCSLTALGYKAARHRPNRPSNTSRMINTVNISGGQFSNFQLATGSQISQTLTSSSNDEIVNQLVELLRDNDHTVSAAERSELELAVHEASEGNGKNARTILEKICGPTWEILRPIIWPFLSELLKKSIGLEFQESCYL